MKNSKNGIVDRNYSSLLALINCFFCQLKIEISAIGHATEARAKSQRHVGLAMKL